jgi:FkbH-like protein
MSQSSHLHWLPSLADADEALRALGRLPDAAARLAQIEHVARHQLDFLQTGKLQRILARTLAEIAAPAGLAPLKLAWLCSSTVDHLVPATQIAALRRGLLLSSYVTPYNQYRQALHDPGSPLFAFAPNAVIFGLDPGELFPGVPLSATPAEVQTAVDDRVSGLRALWARAREQLKCVVIQQIVPDLSPSVFGSLDRLVPGAPAAVAALTNQAIAAAAALDHVLLLDLDAASARLGKETWFDPVRWHHGKQLVAPPMAPLYGDVLARILAAARGLSKKCLVLDLDNTLWGGVVGDDGMENLVLGQGSAAGEAFLAFQRFARALNSRGIVLAVCSKNNHATAEAVFHKHPEMVLKRDDIAVFVANWEDKATNLRRIATTLNLGLDALVFFDDNPAERAIVRQHLPMVAVPEVPEEPALYARCLAEGGYFEAAAFTADDVQRAQQYLGNARREETREAAGGDLGSYLASLNMELTVGHFDDVDLPRVAQLINKTNQFNLTTKRYTEAEVAELRADPGSICLHFRLKDTFGDNGIISVLIARQVAGEPTFAIDTWLMSCRVLGRGVEVAALQVLCAAARQRGATGLVGDYLPTPKNDLVRGHYEKLGFRPLDAGVDGTGSTRWGLALEGAAAAPIHMLIVGARS